MKRNTAKHLIKLKYASSHRSERDSRRGTHLLAADQNNFEPREKWVDKKSRISLNRIFDVPS